MTICIVPVSVPSSELGPPASECVRPLGPKVEGQHPQVSVSPSSTQQGGATLACG